MSLQQINIELTQVFSDEVTNIEFRVPNDMRDNPQTYPWAMLSISEGNFEREAFSEQAFTVYEGIGTFTVSLFAELGTGTKTILEQAERIRDVFNDRYIRVSGIDIRLEYPDIRILGNTNNYYQVNVECPYSSLIEKT